MDAREENKSMLLKRLDGSAELPPELIENAEADNAKEETVLRVYNLRQLEARDMGTMCKIITAIGIRQFRSIFSSDTIKEVMNAAKEGGETGENGANGTASEIIGISAAIDAVGIIMENYPKAESEIISFLASVSGMKSDEVKKLSFADYGQMLIEVVTKDDFKDFFKRVRVLLRI